MYKDLTPEIMTKLKRMSNIEPHGMISALLNFKDRHIDGEGQMDYVVDVATGEKSIEFSSTKVPAQT